MPATFRVAASFAVLFTLGCSGSPSTPSVPTTTGQAPPPATSDAYSSDGRASVNGTLEAGGTTQHALAVFCVAVDPASLSASSELASQRVGTSADVYELPLGQFVTPSTLKITAVESTASTIDLHYSITHPFAAPSDLAAPPTAANRADLGIAGRVLFLTDVASASGNTYFTDVVANTALVDNADGFYAPKGLLGLTGYTANAFPFKALVDETLDPRSSAATGAAISNGGVVAGNYSAINGWQQGNMGPNRDAWSGYGVLHQGQVATNRVSFDRTALGASSFTFEAAILAKYADPRNGVNAAEKKANRLPASPADSNRFLYREPHGALDLERLEVLPSTGQYVVNQLSAVTLRFAVSDWDARATETTGTDLNDEVDPRMVAIGESGAPSLAISIPGVTGDTTSSIDLTEAPEDDDSAYGGDAASDSGQPGDALFYAESVTKSTISGQSAGTFTGLVRATDPEAALTADWHVFLDANLAPLPGAEVPEPVIYQDFTVDQIIPNSPPSATVVRTSSDPMLSGTAPAVSITAIIDTNSDPLDISIDWGDGSGFQTIVSGLASPYANQTPTGPQMNNVDLIADTINVVVRLDDGTVQTDYPLSYTLGANRAPIVSAGTVGLSVASGLSPFTFALTAPGLTVSDPEGNPITFSVTADANHNGSVEQTATGIAALAGYTATPVMGPWTTAQSPVRFQPYANDALHAGVAGTTITTSPSPLLGTVTTITGWALRAGGTGNDNYYSLCLDGTSPIVCGFFTGNVNFGGGVRAGDPGGADGCIVKYDLNGNYLWDYTFGGTSVDYPTHVAVDPSGNVAFTGYTISTSINFGGGARAFGGIQSAYVVRLNAAGTYSWDKVIPTQSSGSGVSLDAAGNVIATGTLNGGTVTAFGGAPLTPVAGGSYIAKLSPTGTHIWSRLQDGPGAEQIFRHAADATGDIYTVGSYTGTGTNFGGGVRGNFGSNDGVVVKYLGTNGNYVWDRVFGGSGSESPGAIAARGASVVITSYLPPTGINFGTGLVTPPYGSLDVYVAKYASSNGVTGWVNFMGSPSADLGANVALDASENVYAVGQFGTGATFGGPVRTVVTGADGFIVKRSPAGAWLWDVAMSGAGVENLTSIGADSAGNLVSVGGLQGASDFNPGAPVFTLTSAGSQDGFAVKVVGATGLW